MRADRRLPGPDEGAAREVGARVPWIDGARGLAICLVVFGHVWGNARTADLIAVRWADPVFDAIYLFHMPMFFILSGMLLARQVTTGRRAAFLRSRAAVILLPLFFWAWVTAILRLIAGQPLDWVDVATAPLDGNSIFWFLWAFLACQLAGVALLTLSVPRIGIVVTVIGVAVGTLLIPAQPGALWYLSLVNLPFFLIGMLVATRSVPTLPIIGIFAFGAFIAAELILPMSDSAMADKLLALVASGGMIVTIATLMAAFPKTLPSLGASMLGRHSMVIYLVHVPFIALVILLPMLGISNLEAQLAIAAIVGIVGPLLTEQVACRLHLHTLVGVQMRGRRSQSPIPVRANLLSPPPVIN